jgi:hypothetical protein
MPKKTFESNHFARYPIILFTIPSGAIIVKNEKIYVDKANESRLENEHQSDELFDGASVKKKKRKDPSAPKKNLNAWMFFIQDVRPQVVADLGAEGNLVVKVTKAVDERWAKMSNEEKQVRPRF